MTFGTGAARAAKFIRATAIGDTTLNGYISGNCKDTIADVDSALPGMVFTLLTSRDILNGQAARAYTEYVYQLAIIGAADSDYTTMAAAADRLDTLFGNLKDIDQTDCTILFCYRETEVNTVAAAGAAGKKYARLGGTYRIAVQLK